MAVPRPVELLRRLARRGDTEVPGSEAPLTTALWAARLIWSLVPRLVIALSAVTVLRGALPAALALTARELINAAVAVMGAGTGDLEPLIPWLAVGFGLTVIEAVSLLLSEYYGKRLHDDLALLVTGNILDHAATLDVAFFEDPGQRDLLSRTREGVAGRLASFVQRGHESAMHLVRTVSLAAVLVVIEPLLIPLVVPFAIPYLFFQLRLAKQRYAEEYGRTERRRWTGYFVGKLTAPESVGEVKLLGLAPLLIERFRTLMAGFRDRDRLFHLRNVRGSSVTAILTALAIYVVFIRVALRTVEGRATLGDLAIFGGAATRLRFSIESAVRGLTQAFEQTLFIANLREFLRVSPGITVSTTDAPDADRPGGPWPSEEAEPQPSRIRIEDVTFTYPGGTEPALLGVTFDIRAGETLALVGENGAGKTTLVKLLARLYDPTDGRILFDGTDLRRIAPEEHRRRVSFVLEGFGRYETTAAENLAYGDWRRLLGDGEAIRDLAEATNLAPLIEAMPDGYDTHLGRMFGTHTLSGGQWQRLALGRAFARDCSFLVLDEPTSNLDALAERELFGRFKELSSRRTTLLISHRFTTLGMADRIVFMGRGRVVEVGTHAELMERGGAYASLYRAYEDLRPAMPTSSSDVSRHH